METVRREVFELLVQRTSTALRHYLLQRCQCRDPHLADDVVQEVFLKLYLRAEQFDPRRSFWGWLYRIAHNGYIDALRRLRPGDVGIGQAGQSEAEADQWLNRMVSQAGSAEAALVDQEAQQKLKETLATLPKLQRDIVELKMEGVKGKEIAVRLGISQAYVSQLFHEAVEYLRLECEG
jgi:RNA polymerase sigma-70 factor (ECF subfamily)